MQCGVLQGLLPLAGRQVRDAAGLPWLGLGMAAALLLSAATMEVGGRLLGVAAGVSCAAMQDIHPPCMPDMRAAPTHPLHTPLLLLQLWLGSGGGNANFLYGMNLLWAGLQAVLLLQLLRAAARQEVAGGSTLSADSAAPAAGDASAARTQPRQRRPEVDG